MQFNRCILTAALLAALGGGSALAQTAQKPSDDAVKAAYLSMPEADRKAAQEALGWLGLYNGLTDGAYGKRTRDAVEAFQKKQGLIVDGVVTPAELAGLKAAAATARAAVGFAAFDDPGTGIRISAPLKLLDKRETGKGRARLFARDGSISLTLAEVADDGALLETLYKKESADADKRKVSYKAYKAGAFFVVAGEAGDSKFYERYAAAPAGAAATLRGFIFAYPKARADDLDRVALAVANAFEPFPSGPAKPAVPAPQPAAAPAKQIFATAFIVKPGLALTALTPRDCAQPTINGLPATYAQADAASGLALLGGSFGADVGPVALADPPAEALTLIRDGGSAEKPGLAAALAAVTTTSGGKLSLLVAAPESGRGAPAFDSTGALVATLSPVAAPRRVNGVVIAEPRAAFGAAALKTLIGESAAPSGAPLTAGDIAKRYRLRVVAVLCGA